VGGDVTLIDCLALYFLFLLAAVGFAAGAGYVVERGAR
jgi:hypothetical protein